MVKSSTRAIKLGLEAREWISNTNSVLDLSIWN